MTCYDSFPIPLVAVNILTALGAATVGVMIVAWFGLWALLGYVIIGSLAVVLSLAFGCTRCCYYGRLCGIGLGKIASLMFRKRDEREFGKSVSQMVAWTLASVILVVPLAAGLISLRYDFTSRQLLCLAAFLGLMTTMMLTHSRLVCARCKQTKRNRCTLGRFIESR